MATFTLEDTSSIRYICLKYDDFAEVIQEDVIAKIKEEVRERRPWQPDHGLRTGGLGLTREDAQPSHLELRVPSRSFDQNRSAHLGRILRLVPGRDGVVLFVQQADGRRFRAELPVSVDAQSTVLKAEIPRPSSARKLRSPSRSVRLTGRTDCSTLRALVHSYSPPCFGLGVGEANRPKGGRI